ncbi:MAG: transglutaminase domain-containing protein [Microgenomates group bacterium]
MFLLTLLLLIFIQPQLSLANSEFDVLQKIEYSVDEVGNAKVTQEINLTNKISQVYSKEYQLIIHNSNIQNITGHDKHGNIIKSVIPESDKTTINLHFDSPTIGKDQTNQFFLLYTIVGFAQQKGKTWEILLPQFENQITDSQLVVSLSVPTSFGELSSAAIPIQSSHLVNNRQSIQLAPISSSSKQLFVFGNNQIFDFKLLYFLKNSQSVSQNLEIPIPPDTNIQTITYQNFDPLPQNIRQDGDGNWLAQYYLSPQQELGITVTGQAKIHASLKKPINIDPSTYLSADKYWDTNSPEITIIKHSLSTPKSIYDYTISTLSYDYNQINNASRKGATAALSSPTNSLCTEFTDLFVTLARSVGIPAREIEGYAYSNNSKIKPTNIGTDILHAWPEFYDQPHKNWIQIDPTWEKTTNGIDYFNDLDLNHITFVIHGLNSQSPPPPGSYKRDSSQKTVYVDFAKSPLIIPEQPLKIKVDNNQLIITNPNLFALNNQIIQTHDKQWSTTLDVLPPLSIHSINLPKIPILTQLLPRYSNYQFTVNNHQQSYVLLILNRYHYLYLSILVGVTIFGLCVGGIILTTHHHSK